MGGRYFCGAKAAVEKDSEELETEILQAEASALPLEQWINDKQALVILGDPGSGKSTSMKRLALGLAQKEEAPLPLLLPLNAYSKVLERKKISFEDFLPEYFHSKRSQLEKNKLKIIFTETLKQQKAFILMDGLDEVGNNRGEVVSQVENFIRAWIPDPESKTTSGNRMVVTSRFVGYRDYPLVDPRWRTVALNDWNQDEIKRFFKSFTLAAEIAWAGGDNNENAKQAAKEEYDSLTGVIQNNNGIRRLSGNPLLASLLALIKRQGVTLPHRRVELYNLYMGTLLRSWNRSRSIDNQPIGPEIDFTPTQRLLAKLALHLRETNPQGGLISEHAMRDYLLNYYQEDGYSRKEADEQTKGFLESVHKYSNLLIEKGHQQYGFIHLTFEEYLAGFGLALEREAKLCKKLPALLEQPEHWKETLLLSLGVMSVVNTDQEKANGILDDLLETENTEHILFTAEVLNDVSAAVLGNRMTRKIQQSLIALMANEKIDVKQRAKAGRLLSESGDPRPGVTIKRENGSPLYKTYLEKKHSIPDIAWEKIEAGTFRMGTEGDEGYSYEKPAMTIDMPSYWMSKYPITNAQYRCFIEAGVYDDKAFWKERMPEAAGQWLAGEMVGDKLLDSIKDKDYRARYRDWLKKDKERFQPKYWNNIRWNADNHPVVGVSWYEALAYSVWLNDYLADINPEMGSSDAIIRLPNEIEWEYAARGIENLNYSWGQEANSIKGNYKETKLGETSAVGLFSEGKAFGLQDMTGNVWEWTSSRWGIDIGKCEFLYGDNYVTQKNEQNDLNNLEYRIVRGGSWNDNSDDVRCAIRDWNRPNFRYSDSGFRVVLVE